MNNPTSWYPETWEWHRRFALIPVGTLSGRFAWMRWVERRWNPDKTLHKGQYGYGEYQGGWEYRLPLVRNK